ncbi:putative membrane protein [Methylobacterium sp. BE186]|nr:putative membrane protein [Methylobacterium sp. BE186]
MTRSLSPEALARIAEAVGEAESRTAGEIVVMVSARAGLYRSPVLLAALIAALAAPWPLIALTGWSAAGIALAQAALALAILSLGASEALRLRLVPARAKRARAREAARRAFRQRGLTRTRGRTGVLIHIALAEQHAEIVADAGVLRAVAPGTWDATIAALLVALRRDEIEAGLVGAVRSVGAILAEACPRSAGDIDELPNRVIVSE